MEFGISKLAKILSLKMVLLQIKKIIDTWTHRKSKLNLSVGCNISNSKFGENNFLGENVSFVNSFINDHSYINNNTKIRNASIGKYCSIGPNVQIVLGVHPTDFVSTHPTFYANNKPFETFSDKVYIEEYNNVIIGNDVWIGEGALIPGGVTIGNGAIITARAVVTKDVEPYSIVGGVPAKHIKYRFDTDTINDINKTEWWNWDKVELQRAYKSFHNSKHFLQEYKK